MRATQEFQDRVGRIDALVRKLESASDSALRRTARELVESLMEIHGAGFERILEIVSEAGEAGAGLVQSLAGDELVSSLLVLYGLHPDDFETRVRRGLDKARPHLRSQGSRVEIIAIAETTVRLKIVGGGPGEEAVVRDALFETAPDAAEVIIEGGKAAGAASSGFVPLSSLRSLTGSPATAANAPQS